MRKAAADRIQPEVMLDRERGGILKRLFVFLGLVAAVYIAYQVYEFYRLATVGAAVQARRLCSGLFVSGRDADSILSQDLAANAGDPMEPAIDYANQAVTSTVWGFAKRKAIYRAGLGCTLVVGATEEEIRSQPFERLEPLPRNPEAIPWPTGDLNAVDPSPPGVDRTKLQQAVARAFEEPDPERPRWTRAVVVVHRGRIVAEQYAPAIERETQLINWSMTKSITNTLVGILVKEGRLSLEQRAPLAAWGDENDPRRAITLNHMLQMSSGLEFSEDYSRSVSDGIEMLYRVKSAGAYASDKPLKVEPGAEFYYSSGTTNILSKILQETLGEKEYLSFPRRALFNKLGMRTAVVCPDPSGAFVLSSYSYASGRDWARFGLLYLNDGTWEGERILPEGWVDYTRTPVSARWTLERGGYGAHFWLNASNDPETIAPSWPDVPDDAFYCGGHEGQYVVIIPSRDLVVVRLGMTHEELGAKWDQGEFLADLLRSIPR